jgi:UDP-glucose/GDP-mannose dehydrogenase family, central domain
MMQNNPTLVVGLGEVGGPLAQVLERGGTVLRHDLERREFEWPIGVMHICIPFREPASFGDAVLDYMERFTPALTIINSTVLPGTTRAVAKASGRPVCYSPVRGKHVDMAWALLHYTKYVAGLSIKSAATAAGHFRAAGLKTQHMSIPETLELAKLAETTYFGVCIAYAQELNRYAEQVGADYSEVTHYFEEVKFLPRRTYFPGFIGGHCVVPNINLLLKISTSPLLQAVLDSNHRRAEELNVKQEDGGGRVKP